LPGQAIYDVDGTKGAAVPTKEISEAMAITATKKEGKTVKRDRKAEAAKPQQDRIYRKTPGTFERVSPDRFATAEKQILTLLGNNLKEARRRESLTQKDVADIMHTSQPFVGAVERGEHDIRLSTLVRLAYAVRTDPGALILGERATNYSLETLVRLVGALHAHLEAQVGSKAKDLPSGEILTLISSAPFRFNVEGGAEGDKPVVKPTSKSR
jgi:transcriptional regulator with XRE-family HTH domain